jgi:hypothetical protein
VGTPVYHKYSDSAHGSILYLLFTCRACLFFTVEHVFHPTLQIILQSKVMEGCRRYIWKKFVDAIRFLWKGAACPFPKAISFCVNTLSRQLPYSTLELIRVGLKPSLLALRNHATALDWGKVQKGDNVRYVIQLVSIEPNYINLPCLIVLDLDFVT